MIIDDQFSPEQRKGTQGSGASNDSTRPTLEIKCAIDFVKIPDFARTIFVAIRFKHPFRKTLDVYTFEQPLVPEAYTIGDIKKLFIGKNNKPYFANYLEDNFDIFNMSLNAMFDAMNVEWINTLDTVRYILKSHRIVLYATNESALEALLTLNRDTDISRVVYIDPKTYHHAIDVFDVRTQQYDSTTINNIRQKINSIQAKIDALKNSVDWELLNSLSEWHTLVASAGKQT